MTHIMHSKVFLFCSVCPGFESAFGASYQPGHKLRATGSTQPDFRNKLDTDSRKPVWFGRDRTQASQYVTVLFSADYSAAIQCDQMSEPIPARVSNVCDTGRKNTP